MTQSSVVHSTFVIERLYKAAPARVFQAFADPAIKRRWFAEGEGWEVEQWDVDFRVEGHEKSRFRFQGGPLIRNDTTYQDIVADRRIITAYTMTIGDKRISSSLATTELLPSGSGTRVVYTEQGAFLDGADTATSREEGCRALFEQLAKELGEPAKPTSDEPK